MMRVDAWYLAVAPLDMRCGMDAMLARVVATFGSARPYCAYAFANRRASRMKVLIHDGFGLWQCTRRLHQGSLYWPSGNQAQISLSAQQWQALTIGLPWQKVTADMQISLV